MSPLYQRIAIVGAGVTGVLTAHALHRAGFRAIRLFDSASSFTAAAPSIQCGPLILPCHGSRLLHRLGLLALIPKTARNDIVKIRSTTTAGHTISSYDPVQLVRDAPHRPRDSSIPTIACHGRDLYIALTRALPKHHDGVEVKFQHTFKELKQNEGNESEKGEKGAMLACFDSIDGPVESGVDLLIADDGLHSPIRSRYLQQGGGEVRSLPGMYVRGVVAADSIAGGGGVSVPHSNELIEMFGAGLKFCYCFIDDGRHIGWLASVSSNYQDALQNPQTRPERMAKLFSSFPAPVPALLSSTLPFSIDTCPSEDLRPPSTFHSADGRVVLVGDAAHGCAQELWQNVALGMEDACMLSELLSKHAPPEAVRLYSQLRAPRIKYALQLTRSEAEQAFRPSKMMASLRDMAMSMMPPKAQLDAIAQLLQYDALREAEQA